MSGFDSEWDDIAKTEVSSGGNYINKAGVALVNITAAELSPKDHQGCPYIEFKFETLGDDKGENKQTSSVRLYRVRDTDSDKGKEFKLKRIKEILHNAGADFNKKGFEVVKTSIGKTINVLFKSSEYIGVIKDENNKPVVRTKVEYSFSSPSNRDIIGTQKYLFSQLSNEDQAKFEGQIKNWERDNGASSPQQNASPSKEEYENAGAGEPSVINVEEDEAEF